MYSPDFHTGAALVLVTRLCLGFIFLPSALGKLTNQSRFIQGIVDYQVLPERLARGFGLILPWFELILALVLLLGIALPLAGVAAMLLLLSFIAAVVINLRRGRQLDCNCYGIASPTTISWGIVVRNILLLLLAAIVVGLAPNAVTPDQWVTRWQMDWQIITSNSVIPLSLLLAFCLVTIHLLEWAVAIHYRVSQITSSQG